MTLYILRARTTQRAKKANIKPVRNKTSKIEKKGSETRQNWTGSFGPVGFNGDDSQDLKEILGENLDIEDYNVIDEQIQRFSQELQEKQSLVGEIQTAFAIAQKLDEDQIEDIIYDVQKQSETLKKALDIAGKLV